MELLAQVMRKVWMGGVTQWSWPHCHATVIQWNSSFGDSCRHRCVLIDYDLRGCCVPVHPTAWSKTSASTTQRLSEGVEGKANMQGITSIWHMPATKIEYPPAYREDNSPIIHAENFNFYSLSWK